ncbi:MAG: hypothetical protein H7235_05380, partial [Bdellovibrionaceae bacterium]|nr:hypothetical protein [Pseudobdellovibrionaceae bacterium]
MKTSINYLYKRKSAVFGIIVVGAVMNLSFQNCAPAITKFTQSSEQVLQKPDILAVSGTEEVQNMCKDAIRLNELMDCSLEVTLPNGSKQSREQWELAQVKAAAAMDSSLQPIKLSYSFGNFTDEVAQVANQRAGLSKSRPFFVNASGVGYMPIPTSNNNYYQVDFNSAKSRFATGQSCFYDTVRLPTVLSGSGSYYDWALALPNANKPMPLAGNAQLFHVAHYMVFDYFAGSSGSSSRYGSAAAGTGKTYIPGRILANAGPVSLPVYENGVATGQSEVQIVNVYFADFRGPQIGLDTETNKIIRIGENHVRGETTEHSVSDILDLKTILANFNTVAARLSVEYIDSSTGLNFSGIHSAKQLLANLCSQSSVKGTSFSVQYTPIVLDLGQRTPQHPEQKIITTSVSEGVKFDMKGDGIARQTAWIGARIKMEDAVSSSGVPMKRIVSELAEDGFLVIPDAQGKVTSSKQLFGSNMEINGHKYTNGFEALAALSGKDCRSGDIKKQYFGPWDGDKYESLVKVWIDKNRNGVSDPGEVISLREAGVPAINTCYTTKYAMTDSSGNETAIRALMLYQSPMTASESEILSALSVQDVK